MEVMDLPREGKTKMPTLNLKPTHKPVKAYYESLDQFDRLGVTHETAVRSAFQSLLESCGKQFDWTLIAEQGNVHKQKDTD